MLRAILTLLLLGISAHALSPAAGAQTDADVATVTAVAVHLSELEAAGRLTELYGLMHPDAQAVVPLDVFRDWHLRRVSPRSLGVLSVLSVQFEPWTWAVTGKQYQNAARVYYAQPIAGASPVLGYLRLVPANDGSWAWFFGRSRAFLDRQLARAGLSPIELSTAESRACEQAAASLLAQLVPPFSSAYVARWFDLTAADLGLPRGCVLPALPPETPWCVPDAPGGTYCVEPVIVRHTPDGSGYCVWLDPSVIAPLGSLEDEFVSPRDPRWSCLYPRPTH